MRNITSTEEIETTKYDDKNTSKYKKQNCG